MKRFLAVLCALFVLMCCSICSASDGSELNRDQKVASKILKIFAGMPATSYDNIVPYLNPKFSEKFTAEKYAALPEDIASNFGKLIRNRFVAFRRLKNSDRLVYRAYFTKAKHVSISFSFNKAGKMTEFTVNPNVPAEERDAMADLLNSARALGYQ